MLDRIMVLVFCTSSCYHLSINQV